MSVEERRPSPRTGSERVWMPASVSRPVRGDEKYRAAAWATALLVELETVELAVERGEVEIVDYEVEWGVYRVLDVDGVQGVEDQDLLYDLRETASQVRSLYRDNRYAMLQRVDTTITIWMPRTRVGEQWNRLAKALASKDMDRIEEEALKFFDALAEHGYTAIAELPRVSRKTTMLTRREAEEIKAAGKRLAEQLRATEEPKTVLRKLVLEGHRENVVAEAGLQGPLAEELRSLLDKPYRRVALLYAARELDEDLFAELHEQLVIRALAGYGAGVIHLAGPDEGPRGIV